MAEFDPYAETLDDLANLARTDPVAAVAATLQHGLHVNGQFHRGVLEFVQQAKQSTRKIISAARKRAVRAVHGDGPDAVEAVLNLADALTKILENKLPDLFAVPTVLPMQVFFGSKEGLQLLTGPWDATRFHELAQRVASKHTVGRDEADSKWTGFYYLGEGKAHARNVDAEALATHRWYAARRAAALED